MLTPDQWYEEVMHDSMGDDGYFLTKTMVTYIKERWRSFGNKPSLKLAKTAENINGWKMYIEISS